MRKSQASLDFDLGAVGSGALPDGRYNRWRAWLIRNDGQRRVFFGVWILTHALIFAMGFLNFQLNGALAFSCV